MTDLPHFHTLLKKKLLLHFPTLSHLLHDEYQSEEEFRNDLIQLCHHLELPEPPPTSLRSFLSRDGEITAESRGMMEELQKKISRLPQQQVVVDIHLDKKKTTSLPLIQIIVIVLLLLLSVACFFFIILRWLACIFLISACVMIYYRSVGRRRNDRINLYIENEPEHLTKHIDFEHRFHRVMHQREADLIISDKFVWGVSESRDTHQEYLDSYRSLSIPVLATWITDNNDMYDVPPNVLFFRTSLYRSLSDPRERALAFVWEELSHQEFRPKPHTVKPIVGFCGAVWEDRKPLLDALEAHPDIETQFIRRDSFWGGGLDKTVVRKEFEENLDACHYTMCNRGAGNFTMRFYQALSVGRIPLYIDTDMQLPYESKIDWDTAVIRGRTIEEVVRKLLDSWQQEDVKERQARCHAIHRQYFQPSIYVNNIICETIP